MRLVSGAGIWISFAITAESSGITVPETAGGVDSVETDSAVGEGWIDSVGTVVGESVGEVELVAVDSGGEAHPAKMELAAIKLPVTEAISLSASRRDNLPSEYSSANSSAR